MALLKQSTAYTRMFLLVQTSDHITGLTGATPTLTLSKAGGAFGAASGAVTEVSSGWYKVALNTSDTGTLGDLAYHITAASGDPCDFVDQVAANILGDTLPANTTQLAGQTVTAAAGVTFPSSVASPTNITAGTITTATNLTTNNDKTGYTLTAGGNNLIATAVLTNNMTESYAAQGAALTLAQALYGLTQQIGQQSIAGTTMTVKKRDGATTAKTYTLDSAVTPTSITETT